MLSRSDASDVRFDALIDLLLELRASARSERDYARSDRIRDALVATGIEIHDGPERTTWSPSARLERSAS